MTKIKICGLKSEADIEIVNEYKPDYCGFIIDFPKSHRSKTPDEVRELVKNLDRKNVIPVGVFVNEPVEEVANLLNDGTIEIAQLHGDEDEAYIRILRCLLDDEEKPCIAKAFQVKSNEDVKNATRSIADIILLDKGQGSGETFDWSLISGNDDPTKLKERPWFLAGGLTEENIVEAIERFHPYAVDLSSAVETEKKKDKDKIKRMIELVRNANSERK